METKFYLTGIEKIELYYELPEHLRDRDTPKLRESDLVLLDRELRESGSSLEEKITSRIIWRMGFPGMIVDVKKLNYDGRRAQMMLSPIHPHRADLAYKNDRTLPRNVAPLTVNALLKSAEGDFVLAVRGGNVEAGKIGIIPGGHTDYEFPLITDPLETFRTEFREELGYDFERSIVPILGLFTNYDTKGVNVLYNAQTDLTFPQILEKWKKAKDRGEHSALFEATTDDIKHLAYTGELTVDGKRFGTTSFFQDCFRLYTECF